MCGILGSVNFNITNRELDLIASRGPDDSGMEEYVVCDNKVILGHRRLSIVDLSQAGHQPMLDVSNQYVLAYNGEVYNHNELRSRISGVEYIGHSDTETILYYLIKNGIESTRDLNGIFAFSLLDKKNNKLYLARDPFGIKPLYYRVSGETLVFSSEIKPIFQVSRGSISLQNLSELLVIRYSPSPETLFEDIKKVRPGHFIEVDLSKKPFSIKEQPYITYKSETIDLKYEDALAEYGRLFEQAIERQLMADVDIGVLLSGGIDSALVAKYAAMKSGNKLKAFTVGFENAGYEDEIEDAMESAEIIGMEHHELKINFNDFLDNIKHCVHVVEEPTATTSIVPMYFLSKLASSNVKVVLSGQGADEPLGGYRKYQGELIYDKIPLNVVGKMAPLFRSLGLRNDAILRGLNTISESSDIDRFIISNRVFDDNDILHLIGTKNNVLRNKIEYFYKILDCDNKHEAVEKMMSLDLRMNLSDDLLLYTDKLTMHHSLECRVPMLDHDLVKFVESLPTKYKLRLGKTKIIHKDLAKKVLPRNIINRKKKGFLSPTKAWFKDKDIIGSLLLDKSSRFSSVFNLAAVENIIDQHINGFNRERHIFLLLSCFFWLEEFS